MDKNMYSCSKKDGCPYQTGNEQLKSAHDRIDELEGILRSVEWSKSFYYESSPYKWCPSCRATNDDGHEDWCHIAEALAVQQSEKE